jgi:ferredoxin-type protein NapF
MSAPNPSRRAFLRGRIRPEAVMRPPWSPGEAAFTRACDRCGDCVRACPAGILTPGSGGYPETRFDHAGCSLCGDCLTACAGKVLQGDPLVDRPWPFQAVIAQGCLAETGVICRGCGDVCDTRAIRFTPRVAAPALPRLDPELCNGCGECLSRCPAGAIRIAARQSEVAGDPSADGLDLPTRPQTVVSAHEHL